MEEWIKYALIAAIFISVRDIISKKITMKYTYIDYVGYATLITTIGIWSYIFINNIQMKPLDTEYFFIILLRLAIAYLIVEPAIYYCLKGSKNTGEASSIINMNVIFAFFLSLYAFNAKFEIQKLGGIVLILFGSYYVTK